MRVFPEYQGPMIDWPQVEAIDGILDTLNEVKNQYRLVLASNAGDSNADDVRRALTRSGLDGFFSDILVSREIGFQKPQHQFFDMVISRLHLNAQETLHIGDDYQNDVLAAHSAGLRTLWFNPGNQPAVGLLPQQDLEIVHMRELGVVLQDDWPPDLATCLQWLLQNEASSLLFGHIHCVAAAAYRLALWLRLKGEQVDPLLTHRGGLLHDIAKGHSRQAGIDHGRLGAEYLRTNGEEALAEITLRHPLFSINSIERKPLTWEQKCVYLADKLVEGSAPTTLALRLQYLEKRYPDDALRIRETASSIEALFDEISKHSGIGYENLSNELFKAMYA